MRSIKQTIRTILLVGGSLLVALGYPLSVLADEIPTAGTDPSIISAPAEQAPVGDAAPPAESSDTPPAAAISEPSTEAPVAAVPDPPKTTYTYDAATGRWNSNNWTYNPASGKYEKTVQPAAAPAIVDPKASSDTSSLGLDSSTTSAIANAFSAAATSGDASVIGNGLAGSATTGDASSVATIVNNVNSSMANSSNKEAAQFVSNIMGDVNGDIMLQPMLLKVMLEAAAQKSDTSIRSTTDTAINNDIALTAQSGDATVAKNTAAGNATSGSANTVANVLNIVNSMIAANQSFIGTVNIYGNLNGDILIAPDFIPSLLASNGETEDTSKAVATASITSENNTSVVNNIALAAKTGEALVSGNTAAGNATSGTATTNAVIFNLTNHEVVASNSLLVFVNVLGRWVGVIIDAPTGATAAAIGDGVTKNNVTPNLVIDAVNTTAITNTIDLSSTSGNATVARNTLAGNALTGNATASANVANIVGNTMGLSGWFGVLFINVFGSWVGSFGIDTAAGNAIPPPQASGSAAGTQPVHVIQFVPRAASQARRATVVLAGSVAPLPGQPESVVEEVSAVNGVMSSDEGNLLAGPIENNVAPIDRLNLPMIAASLALAGGSLLGLRRLGLFGSSVKNVAQ